MTSKETTKMSTNEIIEKKMNDMVTNKKILKAKQIKFSRFYKLINYAPIKRGSKGNKKRDRSMKHDRFGKEENDNQYFIFRRDTRLDQNF